MFPGRTRLRQGLAKVSRSRGVSGKIARDMKAKFRTAVLIAVTVCFHFCGPLAAGNGPEQTVRFATFNVSLYDSDAGIVAKRLTRKNDPQAAAIAEIIQRVRPDVLLLNEVDYDAEGRLIALFQQNYLSRGQNVSQSPSGPAEPIDFPYRYLAPSNTGMHSGFDLDRNGRVDATSGSEHYGGDCWGFGRYPGQYAMALLSRFPIDRKSARTFCKFLWKDMPGARLPDNSSTSDEGDWYSADILAQFPLSSKSHWDISVDVHGQTIHILASHPTPPTYDGPEDRNGRRNHDELRFWVDYIGPPEKSKYIVDDAGGEGGLPPGEPFVILGDLNGDPLDGQGKEGIARLLASPHILATPAPQSEGGAEQSIEQGGANKNHRGNPRFDTLDAADLPGPGNLRLDYVLPSSNLPSLGMRVATSGVYWPRSDEPAFRLVGTHPFPSSDHRLVWIDIVLKNP